MASSRYARVTWSLLAIGLLEAAALGMFRAQISWPAILWGLGGLFLLLGITGGIAPLAIPGVLIGGLGLILEYQNVTGAWYSWAYTWALIPVLVGLGLLLAFGRSRTMRTIGLLMTGWSLVVFTLFGLIFSRQAALARLWPAALVLAGLVVLLQALLLRRTSPGR